MLGERLGSFAIRGELRGLPAQNDVKAMPTAPELRQTTSQDRLGWPSSFRSKASGMPSTEATSSRAPASEMLRSVQLMVDEALLNTMRPPLRARLRWKSRRSEDVVVSMVAPQHQQKNQCV